ncbi:MAG: two-component system cell cycle sensor histidine kinase/response regulator CckA [Candidatus Paceibacteria bacterium]|jgi:two-component system cell cycle sensor histidine kinase/response regulator CckA
MTPLERSRRYWKRLAFLCSLSLACLLLSPSRVYSQRRQTETFTERDGLPGIWALDMCQAKDGRLWFAFRGALASYDGKVWESFLPGEGLPSDFEPQHVTSDSSGTVWVLASKPSRGMVKLKDGVMTHITVPTDLEDLNRSSSMALMESEQGEVRIAAIVDSVLIMYSNGHWETVRRLDNNKDCLPLALKALGQDLYIATECGVEQLKLGDTRTRSLIELEDSSNYVGAIYPLELEDGTVRTWMVCKDWFGYHENGKLAKIPVEVPTYEAQHRYPVQIIPDGTGGLYFGIPTKLFHYDAEQNTVTTFGMREGMVSEGATSMLKDLDQNFWIGTCRGVTRFGPQRFDTYDSGQGMLDNEVTSIVQLEPERFALGHNWGLSFMDGKQFTALPLGKPNPTDLRLGRALDMALADSGALWVAAMDQGLAEIAANGTVTWHGRADDEPVTTVCAHTDGNIYAGTTRGLKILIDGAVQPLAFPTKRPHIRKIVSGKDGTLYAVAILGGLYFRREGIWHHALSQVPDQCLDIFAVHEDSTGKIWVGARDGLFVLQGTALQRDPEGPHFTKAVYCVLNSSDGALWLGGSSGVSRWFEGELASYGINEGLAGTDVNRDALFEDDLGNVWIGTDSGLSRFRGDFPNEPRRVPVEIIDLQANDLNQGEGVRTLTNGSRLVCNFRVVSFEGDRKTFYRHRLLGLDDEWSKAAPVGKGLLSFPSLPTGNYQLELQARSHHGDWGPVESSQRMRVVAPIWQRAWFISLASLAGISLALLLRSLLKSRRRSLGLEKEVKEGHDALEATRIRHEQMFQRYPAALLLLAPDSGVVLDANIAAQKHLKVSLDALRGQLLCDLCGFSPDELRAGLLTLNNGHEWVTRPCKGEPDSGSLVEIKMSLLPLKAGAIVQAAIQEVDVAARLKQQLQSAQAMQAVGEIATGVAHDFNNILTAILGHNELIQFAAGTDQTLLRHAAQVRRAGERGAGLIRHLMAYGRDQKPNPQELDLNSIIRSVDSILRSVLGPLISIRFDLAESLGVIHGDRNQLERVLINLTLHAKDSMLEGGELFIQTRMVSADDLPQEQGIVPTTQEQSGAHVKLSVQDTGIGMSADDRNTVFDPFFPAKRHGIGPGRGLAAIMSTVRSHDARVQVVSELGEGTAVHLFFPSATTTSKVSASDPQEATARESLLLVDDNEDVRRTIARLLSAAGYEVLEACSAEDARELVLQHPNAIDILLTDLRLPGENGRVLARDFQKSHPHMRVLLMSGQEDPAVDDKAVFLLKPFSVGKLKQALTRTTL